MRPATITGRGRRLASLLAAAGAVAMTATTGVAAAAAAAGGPADHTACMQATSATHFMAFVVPAGSGAAAAGGLSSLHAPKVGLGLDGGIG